MHIVKELIDNILSTSLNRFLTEQKIANEQRLSFSDQRVLLEQLCQSGLISVEDLNDFAGFKESRKYAVVLCQEKVQVKHELFTSIICLMPHLFPFVLVLSNISFRSH